MQILEQFNDNFEKPVLHNEIIYFKLEIFKNFSINDAFSNLPLRVFATILLGPLTLYILINKTVHRQ